jgi:hypothetical protein
MDLGLGINLHKKLLPDWSNDDFDSTSYELAKAKYIEIDILDMITLTAEGIVYSENRTKNKIKEWIDVIGSLIP